MSVNSPVAGLREPTLARAVVALPATTTVAPAGTARARRGARAPGAHRDPHGTFWRTTMHEFVFFMTMGAVKPWRRGRATVRT